MPQKNIVIGLVLAAAVIGAGAYYWHETTGEKTADVGTAETTTLPTGASSDDASLSQDLSAIDAQMNAAHADVTSANASVNAAQ